MPEDQLLIHVGMAKSASTWLQKRLFNRSDLGFLHLEEKRLSLFRKILPQDTPYYDEEDCRQYLKEELLDQAYHHSLLPVWSNELLSGWPTYGGQSRVLIANRLASLYPDAKILLIVREQNSIINSTYNQYIQEGGTMNLQTYLTKKWVAPYFQGFNLAQYDYYQLVSLYKDLFKPQNVLFLPYELLKYEAPQFVKRIFDFAELKHQFDSDLLTDKALNQAPSDSNLWLRKQLGKLVSNRISASNQNALYYNYQVEKLWKIMELPRFVDSRLKRKKSNIIDAHVGHTFRESNRMLQNLTDIDLETLGYDL